MYEILEIEHQLTAIIPISKNKRFLYKMCSFVKKKKIQMRTRTKNGTNTFDGRRCHSASWPFLLDVNSICYYKTVRLIRNRFSCWSSCRAIFSKLNIRSGIFCCLVAYFQYRVCLHVQCLHKMKFWLLQSNIDNERFAKNHTQIHTHSPYGTTNYDGRLRCIKREILCVLCSELFFLHNENLILTKNHNYFFSTQQLVVHFKSMFIEKLWLNI